MARIYIKDLIKSMLKMDSIDGRTHSTVSLCSRTSTDDETDQDSISQHTLGLHSPTGPLRGRSVKEFEESLTNLRKENFNLKLRIYFLEERMGTNFNLDKENAIKKNIELKVEVESLRKELLEKQELLCQAVKAMELEEDEHKKESQEKEKQINNLQVQLNNLQQKYDVFQEELRSQGDHGLEEEAKDHYGQPFNLRKNDSGFDDIIVKDLENKIRDLESQLSKEKDTVRELDNLLRLAENKNANILNLESEIKHKEDTIKKLFIELEERSKKISSYNLQVETLEDEVLEKKNDIDYIRKDLKEKSNQIKELQIEVDDYQKLLNETQNLYDIEKRKLEKHKAAIMQRNNKIVDLENHMEKQKSKIISLEARLEAAQNEVQRKNNELQTLKSPLRKTKTINTDVDSFLVRNAAAAADLSPKKDLLKFKSPTNSSHRSFTSTNSNNLDENSGALVTYTPDSSKDGDANLDQLHKELVKSKKHIFKLEQDQLRACKIIQSMIDTRKKNSEEIERLKSLLQKKDSQLGQLSDRITKQETKETKSLQAKITELNLSATVNPSADSETSMAEVNEDPKNLLEQYKELTDNLEEQKQVLIITLEETKAQMGDIETKYNSILSELKTKENRIVDLEFELLSLNQGVNDCLGEKSDIGNEKPSQFFLKEIEEKDREIERLESELRKRTCDLQGIVNNELWEKNREIEKLQNRYGDILVGKDLEISKLEENINNKNKQIKVIKDRIAELGVDLYVNGDSGEIQIKKVDIINEDIKDLEERLRSSINERDYFKNQVHELEAQLKSSLDTNELELMRNEHKYLQEELVKCEKLRQDTNEVSLILSNRLEELAVFLDTLLKQKSVLGFLGNKQNDKIRKLLNQSLDISRSLTLSMTLNPNESLLQLSNITSFLNTTRSNITDDLIEGEESAILSVIPANVTLTYQSHLYKAANVFETKVEEQSQMIEILRNQVDNLKRELELRDREITKLTVERASLTVTQAVQNDQQLVDVLIAMKPNESNSRIDSPEKIFDNLVSAKSKSNFSSEKSGLNTSTTLKYRSDFHSESESWSEPDRAVSMARIGLYEDCLRPSSNSKRVKSGEISTEDEHQDRSLTKGSSRKSMLAENRQTIIALQEHICELEINVRDKETEIHVIKGAYLEIQQALDDERVSHTESERQKQKLEETIRDTELQLTKAENGRQNAEAQLLSLQKTVNEVKMSQQLLQETLELKNKETQNRINKMEIEKNKLLEALRLTEENAEDARMDVETSEGKLKLMQEEMVLIEQSIRREAQHDLDQALRDKEKEFEEKMTSVENKFKAQIKKLTQTAHELKAKYDAEYVKRCEVDKLMQTIKELEQVQQIVNVAEENINNLRESEATLKQRLHDTEQMYQEKLNCVHQDLERANLLYSETLLEKSWLINEKSTLESQVKEFSEKETEFIKQVHEYKDDFHSMKETFQKQVIRLENEKSRLEMHISELEVRISELQELNADLKNKLVKHHSGDHVISEPIPIPIPVPVRQPAPEHPISKSAPEHHISKSAPEHHISKSEPHSPSKILDLFLTKTNTIPPYKRQYSDNSGYTSEEMPNINEIVPNVKEIVRRSMMEQSHAPIDVDRHHSNSSPDLGIESDHGRFSSLEAATMPRPFLKTLELTESMTNLLCQEHNQSILCNNEICTTKTKEIVNENHDLRRRLLRTRRALEETVSQLTLANQRKKQVEKTICKQIHKTSQVLRKAKANLDSGSENELIKK